MIALGFAERLEVIAPAFFLLAVVAEMYRPGMQAAVADLVRPADRVRAFGLIYWVINLGFAIGLALGGVLAGFSFRWLFIGDGVTTLAFGLLIWLGVPESRPARTAPSPGRPGPPPGAGFLAPYRDPTFVAFLGLSFLFALLFMQSASTLPLDMAAHGMSKATFGAVLAINGILIVLIQPVLGPLLARHDRSRTLAAGAALAGIGFGLNAIAGTAPLYALGVVVWTVGEIGVLPVANTVVADLAPSDLRGRYQGAYGLAFGLAVCLAPVLGTLALQRAGSVALWSGCLALGALVAVGQLALAPALGRARATRMAREEAIHAERVAAT
jgi:MFS family permease